MHSTQYDESEIDDVFRRVCRSWIDKIRHAERHKEAVFGKRAMECQQFYDGAKDWMDLMGNGSGMNAGDGFPTPTFQVSVNKTFEFVTIFGPALYYENPVRTCKPRMPAIIPPDFFADPSVYQAVGVQENHRIQVDGLRGVLLQAMLNFSPNDYSLSRESRLAIDEALIKGRGCIWTELYRGPGTNFNAVRSTWDSVDALLVDPDAKRLETATWIARKCVHPRWQVERDFGIRPGALRGNTESQAVQAAAEGADASGALHYDRRRGLTSDLIVYWKIWSKMGIGGRLQGFDPGIGRALEMFGDFAYIVVAEGHPFPLNLPPDVVNDPGFTADPRGVFRRTQWPTPTWAGGSWPVTCLDFHAIHNCPWPMAHLKAGMGELKFLNWANSFLLSKIRTTSRDFIAARKSAGEELKNQILHGPDLSFLELDGPDQMNIQEVVQFLQHPPMNGDIWKVIAAVEQNFDKRVGLTELMYGNGGSTQIRSAQEAALRNQNMSVRPQDMAKQVEAWQSAIAANEALCARWHLTGRDVGPILGPLAGQAWDTYVATKDLQAAAHQLEYRVEAGSTQRPNKQAQDQHATAGFQALAPIFQGYAQQTGDMRPLNNLISGYAETLDMDPAKFQLSAPPPPPQPSAPPGEPGSKAAAEAQGGA